MRRSLIGFLVLLAVTALSYAPAWHGTPVWDDGGHLTRLDLQSLDGLRRIWLSPGATQQYYPVTHTAFWVQHRLWGDVTTGYHLVSIALHVWTAWMAGLLLLRLGVPGAWLAAALFALHPVHVESVAWMSELKNTLSGACAATAALLYMRWHADRRTGACVGALTLFVLALLSKSVTASLPVVLAILVWWKHGALSWREDVRPLVPFVILASAAALMTIWFERVGIGATGDEYAFGGMERTLIAGRAIWFYATSLVWPADLMFNYPRWHIDSGQARAYMYPLGVAAVFGLLWWKRGDWGRGPLAAAAMFVVLLGPALGFVHAYPFRFSFVADHFQYLASLAILVPAATVVARVSGRRPLWQAAAVLCLPLAWLTWQQSAHYVNEETLYRETLARNPDSWLAHTNLSAVLAKRSGIDPQQVLRHAHAALRLKPDSPVVQYNAAIALELDGRPVEAVSHYRAAVEGFGDVPSEGGNLRLGQVLHRLGVVLAASGRTDDAVSTLQDALRHRQRDPDVHTDLALILARRRDFDAAIEHFRTAVVLRPDSGALTNLGGVALEAGRVEEAVQWLEQAIALNPVLVDAFHNLGAALIRLERWRDAALAFQRVLQLTGPSADLLTRIGVLWLEAGERDEAVRHLRGALELSPSHRTAQAALQQALAGGDSV